MLILNELAYMLLAQSYLTAENNSGTVATETQSLTLIYILKFVNINSPYCYMK